MDYSIWLNFGGQSLSELHNKIQSIARRYSSPEFPPHLTLVGDLKLELNDVRKVANKFAYGAIPSEISVRGTGSSEKYFMALFLAVDIPSELQSLRMLVAKSANPKGYELDDPHVSIAYGDLDPHTLEKERKLLESEFNQKRLLVKNISIMKSSKAVPVADWKLVETISLDQTFSIQSP